MKNKIFKSILVAGLLFSTVNIFAQNANSQIEDSQGEISSANFADSL